MHAHSLDCVLHCVGPPCSHRSMKNASPCSRSRSHGRRTRPRTGSRSKSPPSWSCSWPRPARCTTCLNRRPHAHVLTTAPRQTSKMHTHTNNIAHLPSERSPRERLFPSCACVCYISALAHTNHPVIGRRFRWREGRCAHGRARSPRTPQRQKTIVRQTSIHALLTVCCICASHHVHACVTYQLTRTHHPPLIGLWFRWREAVCARARALSANSKLQNDRRYR